MTVIATVSSQGQITIPASIRELFGIMPKHKIIISAEKDGIKLKRAETIDEMAERFSKYIKPGIKPLENASEFYNTRKPRV